MAAAEGHWWSRPEMPDRELSKLARPYLWTALVAIIALLAAYGPARSEPACPWSWTEFGCPV
jgi:hypothetical protein